MKNKVYLYVFDTMADLEIGYLSTEINSGRYYKKGLMPLKIVTVSSILHSLSSISGNISRPPIVVIGFLLIPTVTIFRGINPFL